MTDIAPTSEAEIVDAVLAASDPMLICGNNGKSGLLRPMQTAQTLTTRALTGITLYSPQELIIAARSGTPLAEIEAAVAERGQHLIAEPPDFSGLFGATTPQTLGGVVAANLSGPRRVAWGAMRDHVMGLRAVNGSGEAIHSGGRVLKNVTGLDLCKLLTGSHGTLAVITEITLKVLPTPQRRGTLVLQGLDPEAAVAAMSAALGSPYAVSAAAHLPAEAAASIPVLAQFQASITLARIEDFSASVTYRLDRLARDLSAYGAGTLLDDAESTSAWAAIRDAAPLRHQPGALWRVSVRPSNGPKIVAALQSQATQWFMDWGGGLIWIAGPAIPSMHQSVRAAARASGGTWTLFRGPDGLRASVDVLPPEPPALEKIRRAVKAAFDPKSLFNPGRMYAGL